MLTSEWVAERIRDYMELRSQVKERLDKRRSFVAGLQKELDYELEELRRDTQDYHDLDGHVHALTRVECEMQELR